MKYGELNLGQIEAMVNKMGGMVGVEKYLAGQLKLVPIEPTEPKKLLELMTTVSAAAIESFKAANHFKVDTKKAAVRIAWFGDNFKKNFLRKEEGVSEAVELKVHKLLESSLDAPTITELGDNHEITLGQFFSLLSKQGKGEQGAFLVNGRANIAYIRDVGGILWAVSACWSVEDGGWNVEASSVGHPDRWDGGNQVVSL
ncbi:hypothetical protein K2Q00_00140 [Patescibacteria group bacterium]|nr:hypothetical protein [Patescibacteria group bacterium]